MGTLNYPEMTCGRTSRNETRRKSSIVLPQVNFEQPSSDSTEVVKKEGQCWNERKASVDVTSEAPTLMVHCFILFFPVVFIVMDVMGS